MADEPTAPIEIPWRLAATTQRLKAQGAPPDDVTVSLFHYEPTLDTLDRDYPDHRVIYLKTTVSVSPISIDPATIASWGFSGWLEQLLLRYYLEGGLPVWHLLLDLVVTPRPFVSGGIEPYFHAAKPTSRDMIETGVIGNDLFEGTAEGVAFGKSASQLNETVSSRTRTKSKGFGFGTGKLPGPGFSVGSTSTTVDSERNVDQTVETTTREASKERRELLSHMTNVENVLALLRANHIGSPYLRFSLWPRPLRLLSVDATDPNLWYQELLYRRSRGIEGTQEFIAVLVVPRGMSFCVNVAMTRFGVLDVPPKRPRLPRVGPTAGPNSLHDRATVADKNEVALYLHEKYPVGFPLDQLDVDVLEQIEAAKNDKIYPRPAVNWWQAKTDLSQWEHAFAALVEVGFSSPATDEHGTPTAYSGGVAYYKDFNQVQYEREEEEYQRQLARSPLERGKVLTRKTTLDTCFEWAGDGSAHVVGTSAASQFGAVPHQQAAPPPVGAAGRSPSSAQTYRSVMLRWNRLQDEFARRMTAMESVRLEPVQPDDPTMVALYVESMSTLDRDDPLNIGLPEAAARFGLSAEQQQRLSAMGVSDLRGLATVLRAGERMYALQAATQRYLDSLSERDRCRTPLRPIEVRWTPDDLRALWEGFRRALRRPTSGDDPTVAWSPGSWNQPR